MSDTEDKPLYRIRAGRYFQQQVDRVSNESHVWIPGHPDRYTNSTGVTAHIRWCDVNKCVPYLQHNAGAGVLSTTRTDTQGPDDLGFHMVDTLHCTVLGAEAVKAPLVEGTDLVQLDGFSSAGVAVIVLNCCMSIEDMHGELLEAIPDELLE